MKVRRMTIGFILLSIVVLSVSVNSCGGKATGADGTVIAEFDWNGKHQITLEDMQQEISELTDYQQKRYQDKEGLEKYMTLMAESRLILCLARDQKLDENPEIVKRVQDRFHELMVDKIIDLEVEQKLKLTEEDYRQYYEAYKNDYVEPDEVRLTCITLRAEERAKEVLQRITKGEDIAGIAKELKDKGELIGPGSKLETPGDTGFFTRKDYSREAVKGFSDAAFALEIDQVHGGIVSVEIRGFKSYMIFRKDDYKPKRQKAFEEEGVRQKVEQNAKREKRKTLMADWLAQLRERAKIEIFMDRIPGPPQEAHPDEEESRGNK